MANANVNHWADKLGDLQREYEKLERQLAEVQKQLSQQIDWRMNNEVAANQFKARAVQAEAQLAEARQQLEEYKQLEADVDLMGQLKQAQQRLAALTAA